MSSGGGLCCNQAQKDHHVKGQNNKHFINFNHIYTSTIYCALGGGGAQRGCAPEVGCRAVKHLLTDHLFHHIINFVVLYTKTLTYYSVTDNYYIIGLISERIS